MDITFLPSNQKIDGHNYCLNIIHDTPGWKVTYSFSGVDPLGMDFFPTLEEAVISLCKRLDIPLPEINEGWLKENGYSSEPEYDGLLERWISEDKTIEITKDSNMIGRDWYVHVDNWDFETIGGLSIKYVWQLEEFLKLLGR